MEGQDCRHTGKRHVTWVSLWGPTAGTQSRDNNSMQRTWFCAYQQPAIRDCVIPSPTHTLPFPNAPSSFWCFLLISKHCTASCNTAPGPSLHPLQQAMLRASLGWKPVTNKHSLSAYGRCSSSSAAVTNFQWLPTAWITSKNVNLLGPYPLFPDTSY